MGGARPGCLTGGFPQGAGSWGAPRERSSSGAWREPTKQSRVLISHRSHATTRCSGCCPTFQSHTFASDFNGLHHSPKLYLTERGGSQQAAARNQSNRAPGVCLGSAVSSGSLLAAGSSGHAPQDILGDADAPMYPRTHSPAVPSPDGRVLRVSVSAPSSPAALPPGGLSPPHPRCTCTTPSSEQRALAAAGRAK